MEKVENFFERVKELLKQNGQTIKEFLEDCEINYEMYNGLRRYNNLPRADEAVKIAKKLNTSVEYLVTGEKPELTNQQVMESLQKLSLIMKYIDNHDTTLKDIYKDIELPNQNQ